MLTPTVISAIFECQTPDIRVLEEALKIGSLTEVERKMLIAIVGGQKRMERKRIGRARYLRHYRRIAAKLS